MKQQEPGENSAAAAGAEKAKSQKRAAHGKDKNESEKKHCEALKDSLALIRRGLG